MPLMRWGLSATAFALGTMAVPAAAQDMPGMTMPAPAKKPAATKPPAAEKETAKPEARHPAETHEMPGMTMPAGAVQGEDAGHAMTMTGALGSYPMERESSGTAWQPDTSRHSGLHVMTGGWTLMAHGVVNLVYDHQSGPRGGDKGFASGMLMG